MEARKRDRVFEGEYKVLNCHSRSRSMEKRKMALYRRQREMRRR